MNEHELVRTLEAIHRDAADMAPGAGLRGRLLDIPSVRSDVGQPAPAGPGLSSRSIPLAAAAAVLALVGATVLLVWLVRSPSDEALLVGSTPAARTEPTATPAAMDESAYSRVDDLLAGASLEVEEVEPGVLRVVTDGVRDLAVPLPPYSYGEHDMRITVGLDDSVWVHPQARNYKGRPQAMHPGHELPFRIGQPADQRVGEPGSDHDGVDGSPLDGPLGHDAMYVSADSGLYLQADGVWQFVDEPDGDAWRHWNDAGTEVAFDPAGGVWAYRQAFDRGVLAHTDDGLTWGTTIDVPVDSAPGSGYMWVSRDGRIWLGGEGHLARYDGESWLHVDAPRGSSLRPVDVGLDGTAWALLEGESVLLRLDGDQWTRFDEADGVPPMGGHEMPVVLEVAPDGSIWVNSVPMAPDDWDASKNTDECNGVHRFDGATWSRYLTDLCVYDVEVASDGTAWVRAGKLDLGADRAEGSGSVDVYAIPDATPSP